MAKTTSLQDLILDKLCTERQVVTVFTINGYQMRGRITAFDQFTVVVEIRDAQNLIYKSAISTIRPDKPLDLSALTEGGSQG